jgi:tRNA-binding EMAP/Myf-like protein
LIKKQELRFPLNKISAFRVERADKLYEIVLVFKTGEYLRLVTGYTSQRPADKIVGKIENFLSSKKA